MVQITKQAVETVEIPGVDGEAKIVRKNDFQSGKEAALYG